jgi:hypothetical protein
VIAALFVETGGCYFGLPNVDPWDKARDARLYAGPYPVVAHPPCQRWGRFAKGSMTKQDQITGDDEGCFEAALFSVRQHGGVLEHPAHSKAWDAFGIRRPNKNGGWAYCGNDSWTCHVEQGHYGHPARKATWLFAKTERMPPQLAWGHCGQRLPAKRLAERGYESARRCGAIGNMSSQQRQRTPIAFRDLLLSIARMSETTEQAA